LVVVAAAAAAAAEAEAARLVGEEKNLSQRLRLRLMRMLTHPKPCMGSVSASSNNRKRYYINIIWNIQELKYSIFYK
jgi:hypothetical protein